MLNEYIFRMRDLASGIRPDLAEQLRRYVERLQAIAWDALELDGRQAIEEALQDGYVQAFLGAVESRWLARIGRPDARPDFHAAITHEFELAFNDAFSQAPFLAKGFLTARGLRLSSHLDKLKQAHEQALAAALV